VVALSPSPSPSSLERRAASHSHDKARLILPLSTPVSFSVAISRM
jgi:hypothetical protein